MNYKGQTQLSDVEKQLIEKILNFSLTIGATTVCFNKIAPDLELDLTENKSEEETIPVELLEEKRFAIYDEQYKYEKELEQIREDSYRSRPIERGTLKERASQISDFILPRLRNIQYDLDEAIENRGKIKTPLLGYFNSTNQTVYLCLGNIGKISRKNTLIHTFIHEMFHAWNYFASGCKGRSVQTIDEPMVEYAALIFLNEIANSLTEFEWVKSDAVQSVMKKQQIIGSTAAYGFGYYLYKQPDSIKLLEAYSPISSRIDPDWADVQEAIELLRPTYPTGKEEQVLELFERIILSKPATKATTTETTIRDLFKDHLAQKGKSQSTIDKYDRELSHSIPQLIRDVLGEPCTTIYDITDYDELCRLDERLWSNPTIAQINSNRHRQPSSAIHKYRDFLNSI